MGKPSESILSQPERTKYQEEARPEGAANLFVTVVVPTRNRAALLADCIASLLKQDFPSDQYEIIVVDDGSTDRTGFVVADLRRDLHGRKVTYLRTAGEGLNAARNKGLSLALGDPILFVDDDIEAPSCWLTEAVAGSLRHPEAGCLGGRIRLRLEGTRPRLCGREPLGETELDLGELEVSVSTVWGANMVVRRKAVDLFGPFNEALPLYGDEEEWQMRIRRGGMSVVYLPRAWLWHRRTREDLQLTNLIRARFRKGQGQAVFSEVIGRTLNPWTEALRIPRYLGHAIKHRCTWGLLAASLQAGLVWGRIRRRFSSVDGRSHHEIGHL